jgi:glutathione S-transferase
MKLYMNPTSPNVRRVRLTAAVLGLQLEERNLDFAKGEQKKPEFLALNPNGPVPTLVDGDFVLTESRAIASSLMYAKQAEVPLAEFPNIQAWFSRISDMDTWTKTNP